MKFPHRINLRSLRVLPLVAFAAAAAAWLAPARSDAQEFRLTPDRKLLMSEQIIERFYVDSVNSDKMVQEAIVAMLKTLDPHSTYSDPEETKELTTPLTGNFSGIGVQFNMLNDTLFVIQTTSGGPSEKVGILPGDRIIQAGDSVIAGRKLPNSRIIKILRGEKGSQVLLKVLRKGSPEPIAFLVTRDDIPVYSVDAAYMADPTTGYIRISRFGEETEKEFEKALSDLRAKGMQNLIIDLEDNGGGYLQAAHQLASHFLEKGDMVVYTDAPKMGRSDFRVERAGDFRKGRLVIMANQYSASAAEILSGAVQDNDRGLIVGRRTFGKGLVQRPLGFPDGSMIRLTIARYYTPSGRCIQKPFTAGDTKDYESDIVTRYEHGEFFSQDSIKHQGPAYHTGIGRTVYGGGGITPDIFVPEDTLGMTSYYKQAAMSGLILQFAFTYTDNNRPKLNTFVDMMSLSKYLVQQNTVEQFATYADKNGLKRRNLMIRKSHKLLEKFINSRIIYNIMDDQAWTAYINLDDPTIEKALSVFKNNEAFPKKPSIKK